MGWGERGGVGGSGKAGRGGGHDIYTYILVFQIFCVCLMDIWLGDYSCVAPCSCWSMKHSCLIGTLCVEYRKRWPSSSFTFNRKREPWDKKVQKKTN